MWLRRYSNLEPVPLEIAREIRCLMEKMCFPSIFPTENQLANQRYPRVSWLEHVKPRVHHQTHAILRTLHTINTITLYLYIYIYLYIYTIIYIYITIYLDMSYVYKYSRSTMLNQSNKAIERDRRLLRLERRTTAQGIP